MCSCLDTGYVFEIQKQAWSGEKKIFSLESMGLLKWYFKHQGKTTTTTTNQPKKKKNPHQAKQTNKKHQKD